MKPKQLGIEQVDVASEAKKGLGVGDLLLHFKVKGDTGLYHVAVVQTAPMRLAGTFRTNCTCWSGFMGFADADRTPVCKHARAVLEFIQEKL